MFEHVADRRAVGIGSAIVVLGLVPYAARLPLAWAVAWAPVASVLSLSAWSIVHNQIHRRIFDREALNAAWSAWIALATGHPPTGLVVTHCHNHHAHVGGEGDWSRPHNAGAGWGVTRCLRYAVTTAARMARGRRAPHVRPLSPRQRRRLRVERWVLYGTAGAALAAAPATFLCFTLPTWIGGTILFLGVNLLQHDGCEPASELDHSRDFVSPVMNWMFFGGGYHTAHHLRPGVHWSELAALHARVVAPRRRRPELSEGSILAFFARRYLVSGQRARHECPES